MIKIRIGSRQSILALTQSEFIKKKLESCTPYEYEIIPFKTEGDLKTDRPLWQLEGKDFFTKELDEALQNNKIDLVVHSLKDLGSDRPNGITLGAITERFYAHDILLIKKKLLPNLKEIEHLEIGTSSPRRIFHVENILGDYLPINKKTQKISAKTLRGNINTRVSKLQKDQYHGIVCAFAGLERLAHHPIYKKELKQLLDGLTYMVLPLSTFPSAASQGALGIEYYAHNNTVPQDTLKQIMSHLCHEETSQSCKAERKIFQSYGGGCHLAVGIHVRKNNDLLIHSHSGTFDSKIIKRFQVNDHTRPKIPPASPHIFIGLPIEKYHPDDPFYCDEIVSKNLLSEHAQNISSTYVTSSYCIPTLEKLYDKQGLLIASGNKTFKLLAQKGHWVHFSSDSLGQTEVKTLLKSELINILSGDFSKNLHVLSSEDATSNLGKIVKCYRRESIAPSSSYSEKIKSTKTFYWTSYPQFKIYQQFFPGLTDSSVIHCCGLGKTFEEFKRNDITVFPFSGLEEFKSWCLGRLDEALYDEPAKSPEI